MSATRITLSNNKGDTSIHKIKRAIKAYQKGSPPDALLKAYEGIIAATAKTFANKNLASSIGSKKLGQLHKTASPGSLGIFRPNLDRPSYEELKTNLVIKLLDDARKQRPIKDNPFAWAKTVAWNYCRDLAAKERTHDRRCPPKPNWTKRSGDAEDYLMAATQNEGANVAEIPEEGAQEKGLSYKGRYLLQVLNRTSAGDPEQLYRRAFPSEDFRRSVEASLDIINAIYAFKRQLTDPDSIPGKYARAWSAIRAAEKRMISIFGRNSWKRVIDYQEAEIQQMIEKEEAKIQRPFDNEKAEVQTCDIDLEDVKDGLDDCKASDNGTGVNKGQIRDRGRGNQSPVNLEENSRFRSLVHAIEEAKSVIDDMSNYVIPDVLLFLGWEDKDGENRYPDLSSINISPPRMMFEVWKRAAELKRGTGNAQEDLRKLKLLFWYQKKRVAGTPLEPLFYKIKDDADFENLRKYQYRNPRRKGALGNYRWITWAIYRKCFIN